MTTTYGVQSNARTKVSPRCVNSRGRGRNLTGGTDMANPNIRTLRHGDELPQGRPRRYRNAAGYIRLRWKVGPGEYVEAYEHRVVAGLPPSDVHVHHRNGVKDDNRRENLQVIEPGRHSRTHHADPRWRDVCDDYRGGMTTVAVGEKYGLTPSAVSRIIRRHGLAARNTNHDRIIDTDDNLIRHLHLNGVSARRIAETLGIGVHVTTSRIRRMGLTPRRQGRMTAEEERKAEQALAAARAEGFTRWSWEREDGAA